MSALLVIVRYSAQRKTRTGTRPSMMEKRVTYRATTLK